MTIQDIENFSEEVVKVLKDYWKNGGFRDRKLTDIPTDDNQVVPKNYVDTQVASIVGLIPSLPISIAHGGTGQITKQTAFDALSPQQTKGDLIGFNTHNTQVPVGTDGQVLTADSSQTVGLKWAVAVNNDFYPNTSPSFGSYFNTVLRVDSNLGWTVSATTVKAANGVWADNATQTGFSFFPGGLATTGSVNNKLQWNSGIDLRMNYMITQHQASATAAPFGANSKASYHGFDNAGNSASASGDITNVARRIGFAHYNGDIYSVSANGTSITTTNLTPDVADTKRYFMIDFTPTSCKFYLNGTLVATHTTNIPNNSSDIFLNFAGYDANGGFPDFWLSQINWSETLS